MRVSVTKHLTMNRFIFALVLGMGSCGEVFGAPPVKDIEFFVERFEVVGDNPLSPGKASEIVAPFAHKAHSLASLREIAKTLEQAIRDRGYSFYRVVLPPQTLESKAVVQLKVVAFRLGDISVEGNRHFSRENVLSSLPDLELGVSPNNETLAQQIKVANNHPQKKLGLTFRQLDKPDTIGAKVTVEDESPHQFTLMMNTRGSQQTGDFRIAAGYQYSNLWGLDHIVNVSYTTSPDHFDEVRQYGASYMLPIYPLRGWLSGYYARSDVDTGTIGGLFQVSGSGELGGVHYQQYLPRWKTYEHWLDIGWDDKLFNNSVVYGRVQDLGVDVRSRPFSVAYRGQLNWQRHHAGFEFGWAGNLGGGDDNTKAAYAGTRAGAKPDWDALRYGAFWDIGLPAAWTWRHSFTGQYSSDPLIPAEQIGLGGLTTIRGYRERETGGDIGHIYKTEIWTPQWLPGLNFLAFYDQGHRELHNPQPGEKDSLWLRSTGMGARWQWRDQLSVSVDLAYAFDRGTQTQPGSGRVHAQLLYRF
jgi:hemolysin activation/secretion protein